MDFREDEERGRKPEVLSVPVIVAAVSGGGGWSCCVGLAVTRSRSAID